MYTTTEAPIIVYILASVNHTLMIPTQSHILEMIVWSSHCFLQLHSLMMGQQSPKHVGVL